jgi:hypothetical protein
MGDEHEDFPTCIAGDRARTRDDVLHVCHLVPARQNAIEFTTDRSPLALELAHPWKRGIIIDKRVGEPGRNAGSAARRQR